MLRYCDSCRQHRPLRDFDLGGGHFSATCLVCAHERSRTEGVAARSARHAQIATREMERQALIEVLAKIDAEIAAISDKHQPTQTVALEKQRRSVIAALVKIDAAIAELHAHPSTSSAPFVRVEVSDVFDGEDADAGDSDLGFGD